MSAGRVVGAGLWALAALYLQGMAAACRVMPRKRGPAGSCAAAARVAACGGGVPPAGIVLDVIRPIVRR